MEPSSSALIRRPINMHLKVQICFDQIIFFPGHRVGNTDPIVLIFTAVIPQNHFELVCCHHSIARTLVAVRGDGL